MSIVTDSSAKAVQFAESMLRDRIRVLERESLENKKSLEQMSKKYRFLAGGAIGALNLMEKQFEAKTDKQRATLLIRALKLLHQTLTLVGLRTQNGSG